MKYRLWCMCPWAVCLGQEEEGRFPLSAVTANCPHLQPMRSCHHFATNFFLQWTFVQNNPSNFLLSSMKECSLHLLSRLAYGSHSFLFSSVQFSHSVMSDYLWPHGLQHSRPPCPSPTPGVHSNHVHQVSDAIQPSHPLSSPSPPAFNLSQNQGRFNG